jgi:hypothetical protein
MGIQTAIRPTTETYVGTLFCGKWKKTYALSCAKNCTQNVAAVAVRIFIALLAIGAATLDLLTWIANTVTIAPIYKTGLKKHFICLIAIVASL